DLLEPSVTILNQSTGANLAGCQWVVTLTNPFGINYYEGSFDNPDKTGQWTEWTVPAKLTQMGGHLPWNLEWIASIKVKDSQARITEDVIKRTIQRPNGNVDGQGSN